MKNTLLKGCMSLAALIMLSTEVYAAPVSNIEAKSLELKSKTRSDRSTFDYIYRATFKNNSSAVNNLTGVISSDAIAIQVIDNFVNIGKLSENEIITSVDTITLRVDRKTPFDPDALIWVFDGDIIDDNAPPTDDDEPISSGSISTALKEGSLYPVGTDVILTLNDAQFSAGTGEVTLLHNENLVESLIVNTNSIIAPNLLVDGINKIVLYANDSEENQLVFEITLWAGSNSAFISILNTQGELITANLKLRLADDETVGSDAVAENGIYDAVNLPSRTVIIEVRTPSNEFGSGALIGGMDSDITITVKGIGEPSDIDNNDFSQGLLGWEINGNGTVTTIPETD